MGLIRTDSGDYVAFSPDFAGRVAKFLNDIIAHDELVMKCPGVRVVP